MENQNKNLFDEGIAKIQEKYPQYDIVGGFGIIYQSGYENITFENSPLPLEVQVEIRNLWDSV